MDARESRFSINEVFAEGDLKLCDLCGALNLVSNPECFACGWHGHFNSQIELIQVAIDLHCREKGILSLADVTGGRELPPAEGKSLFGNTARGIRRILRWMFG
jgi:hypothetical protein